MPSAPLLTGTTGSLRDGESDPEDGQKGFPALVFLCVLAGDISHVFKDRLAARIIPPPVPPPPL